MKKIGAAVLAEGLDAGRLPAEGRAVAWDLLDLGIEPDEHRPSNGIHSPTFGFWMATMVFPDPSEQPEVGALAACIGPAWAMVETTLSTLQQRHRTIALKWKFSKTSGWYVTYDIGSQRLFYLFPRKGDLLMKIVFNEKGVAALKAQGTASEKLSKAKKYPEGLLLEFTAVELSAELLAELLSIKIASVRK